MQQTHVFTSAAFNYIPKVRMLFESLRRHHPEWQLHLALADELRNDINLSNEPFDNVISIEELNIPSWRGWAFCHTIVELATAIKPFALAQLLKLPDTARVIYLDPDIVVFSRLDDIVAALEESNIVLTPHQTVPEETLDAVIDNEICSLKHGVYNLGFVAVAATETGHQFADWWSKRIYHFCRADIPNGLFTDQRWIDLVPAFFEGVAIMRSGRHNVATWNLTTRDFSSDSENNYSVDGEPLGFYHFTGFDSGAHQIMAAKNAAGNRAVQKLIEWYARQTKSLAKDPLAKELWAFGVYSNGTPISNLQRLIYRERVDLQTTFPDPFDAAGYLNWCRNQGKVEYPDLLNDTNQSENSLKKFQVLTPGFRAKSESVNWTKVGGRLRQALSQPKDYLESGKRGWEVLRSVGLKGLKQHLSKDKIYKS